MHVTLEEDGTPAFPYIFAAQFYGTVTGGSDNNVPDSATDITSSTDALLASWQTKNNTQTAMHVVPADPSADPAPLAVSANANVQRVRATDASVDQNSNNLPSYVMGPWFDALQPGGIFRGLPRSQNFSVRLSRAPAAATTQSAVGLGPQGLWVNGAAAFNFLDGSSYSNARGTDVGGGLVSPTAYHVSAASLERGPLATGSHVTVFPLFGGAVNGIVTMREDGEHFLHLHAASAGGNHHDLAAAPGELLMAANFPAAERYRLWTQRQRSSAVETGAYVVTGTEGGLVSELVIPPEGYSAKGYPTLVSSRRGFA